MAICKTQIFSFLSENDAEEEEEGEISTIGKLSCVFFHFSFRLHEQCC